MDLEQFRPALRILARILIEPKLRSKFDASDIVQQTMMDAHKNLAQFQGKTEAELKAWLRKMLIHDLADELRKFARDKRDAGLEVAIHTSSGRVASFLNVPQTSPSAGAARKEEAVRLADAVARLPDDQRDAIELHHLQEYSLEETARRMGRSLGSVASLIHRGIQGLRKILGSEEPS